MSTCGASLRVPSAAQAPTDTEVFPHSPLASCQVIPLLMRQLAHLRMGDRACVRACVHACVRARVRVHVCVCVCVNACVHACVHACAGVCQGREGRGFECQRNARGSKDDIDSKYNPGTVQAKGRETKVPGAKRSLASHL